MPSFRQTLVLTVASAVMVGTCCGVSLSDDRWATAFVAGVAALIATTVRALVLWNRVRPGGGPTAAGWLGIAGQGALATLLGMMVGGGQAAAGSPGWSAAVGGWLFWQGMTVAATGMVFAFLRRGASLPSIGAGGDDA